MRFSKVECDVCREEIRPGLDQRENHTTVIVDRRPTSVASIQNFDLCNEHARELNDWLKPRVDILGRPIRAARPLSSALADA